MFEYKRSYLACYSGGPGPAAAFVFHHDDEGGDDDEDVKAGGSLRVCEHLPRHVPKEDQLERKVLLGLQWLHWDLS